MKYEAKQLLTFENEFTEYRKEFILEFDISEGDTIATSKNISDVGFEIIKLVLNPYGNHYIELEAMECTDEQTYRSWREVMIQNDWKPVDSSFKDDPLLKPFVQVV